MDSMHRNEDAAIANLENELREKDQTINEMSQTIKDKDAALAKQKSELQETNASLDKLKGELQESNASLDKLKGELQESKASPDNLKKEKPIWNSLWPYFLCTTVAALLLYMCMYGGGVEQQPYYTVQVSGPGLESATANFPSHFNVEINGSGFYTVRAELQAVDGSSEVSEKAVFRNFYDIAEMNSDMDIQTQISAAKYSFYFDVIYKAATKGQHILHITVDDKEIASSPFDVTVYPDPRKLTDARIVPGLNSPWDVTINSHGKMVVSESLSTGQVTIMNNDGSVHKVIKKSRSQSEKMT